jgi:hypothetical protein
VEIHLITIKETLYQLTSCILCLQFCNVFATHFSSHQYEVTTEGACEAIIHNIKCSLDFHPNWVILQLDMVDAFNLMSKRVIFQKVCVTSGDIIQLIPFVLTLYAFEFPLFYNHHNRDGNVTIISSTMGTHQGDPLRRALFVLAHFKALRSTTSHFPSYHFHPLQMILTSLALLHCILYI